MKSRSPESHTGDEEDEILLQHTVEKLVRFGQQVGVGPEDMISLLELGVSVPELLAFLDWRAGTA